MFRTTETNLRDLKWWRENFCATRFAALQRPTLLASGLAMESHVEAIRNFKELANITNLWSFMAMCKQVSYATRIKHNLFLLRDRLEPNQYGFLALAKIL